MRQTAGLIIPVLEEGAEPDRLPEYIRLYRRIRNAILSGALPAGSRLPSSRTLAKDLQLSRTTVEAALGQLSAEGFLVRRTGSGTYIADTLPNAPRRPDRFRRGEHPGRPWTPRERHGMETLSRRGREIVGLGATGEQSEGYLFNPCRPALDAIPMNAWRKLAAHHARRMRSALLLPGDPAGYRPLREAVAAYLVASRGVRCDWRQVVILTSTQQALAIASSLLLDPGDPIWMEEPGYASARAAFRAAGARVVTVPVDEEGLDVAAGQARAPSARLAYVTPSHQYPLGMTMTLRRRVALLEWAQANDAWIFEDDYDSEFRYVGRPVAALQGIDGAGRVLYAGTFNKVIFSSLRIAYLVLPADLVEPFARARTLTDGFVASFPQAILADFLEEGHFSLLLRRVRDLYAERRRVFMEAIERELGGLVRIGGAEAGMHATLLLGREIDDRIIAESALRRGVNTPPLSRCYAEIPDRQGLLAYFASAPSERIPAGIAKLRDVLAPSSESEGDGIPLPRAG